MALQLFKIADSTVESPVTSVTFSNIPSGYTDLILKVSSRMSTTNNFYKIEFNGSTSSHTNRRLYGNGAVAASYSGSDIITYSNRSDYTANSFDNTEMYIPNYTSSNNKSISIDNVTETNATNNEMAIIAGLWSNTAAITSIKLTPDSGSFATNSTFTLYGVL
jgi:hypothetical protein